MSDISESPERNTFQHERYLKRKAEEGKTPENDEGVKAHVDLFKTIREHKVTQEQSDEWKKDNMEYDLRSTDWILQKVRENKAYAQNLYAALCNNDFRKLDVIPILSDQTWGCSWRYAGGIIADMRQEGDYIDWYCSGIRGGSSWDDDTLTSGYVPESVVTDEIRADLERLGWLVLDDDNKPV